jgi:predicted phosphodiesterase
MKKITVIGDVHGKYAHYHKIIRQTEQHTYTIQLGDFGFKYDTLKNVDHTKHIIIGGNHDNYDICWNYPHFLTDYGYMNNFNGIDFFYYRGAYSIDRNYRTVGINWWENEQVSIEQFMQARELYREIKPDIVITHDAPMEIVPYLLPPGSRIYENNTNWALNELFNIHQPKIWRFGHYHKSWRMTINGTDFKCLDELETESIS